MENLTKIKLMGTTMENLTKIKLMGTTIMVGIILLTEKYLKELDTRQDQNRFHVPVSNTLYGLLTPEERLRLFVNRDEIVVPTLDPMGQTYDMRLKQWRSVTARNKLVLIRKWGKLVENNGLKTNDFVQLWGYRDNGRLHFAVTLEN